MVDLSRAASDPWFRLASCEGKEAFDTFTMASTAAKRRDGRTAYRCKICRKFHVGNGKAKHKPSGRKR